MDDNHSRSAAYRTARTADGTIVVTLYGDLDLPAVTALSTGFDELTALSEPDLLLDLRLVSFTDCCGLGLLCRVRNRVLARQGRLRLIPPGTDFLRLLRRTGLNGAFQLCQAEAAGWAGAAADRAVGEGVGGGRASVGVQGGVRGRQLGAGGVAAPPGWGRSALAVSPSGGR